MSVDQRDRSSVWPNPSFARVFGLISRLLLTNCPISISFEGPALCRLPLILLLALFGYTGRFVFGLSGRPSRSAGPRPCSERRFWCFELRYYTGPLLPEFFHFAGCSFRSNFGTTYRTCSFLFYTSFLLVVLSDRLRLCSQLSCLRCCIESVRFLHLMRRLIQRGERERGPPSHHRPNGSAV